MAATIYQNCALKPEGSPSPCYLLHCPSQNPPLPGQLKKRDRPQSGWVGLRVKLDLNVVIETMSAIYGSHLNQLLHNSRMTQSPAAIFSAQHLRLSVIQ